MQRKQALEPPKLDQNQFRRPVGDGWVSRGVFPFGSVSSSHTEPGGKLQAV